MKEEYDVVCVVGYTEEEAISSFPDKEIVFFGVSPPSDRCLFVRLENGVCDREAFHEICAYRVFSRFAYCYGSNVSEADRIEIDVCKTIRWQVELFACEYSDFGLKILRNLVSEAEIPVDTEFFLTSEGIFSGIPAFICGAGPSAETHFPRLAENPRTGIIFGGGAALAKMARFGVPLHIGAGVDPDPCYDKVLMQHGFQAPFFYQSRFSPELLATVQGPIFRFPSNPGNPLENWFSDEHIFDGGWTVSTFCVALACRFGCNPITLVGVDLASDPEEEGISYDDRVTRKDWVLASKWLTALSIRYPDTQFRTVSESGLSIPGFSLCREEETKQYDPEGAVQLLAARYRKSVGREVYRERLTESLLTCDRSLDALLALCERYHPVYPGEKGEYVLYRFELEEQIGYKVVLGPVWEIWKHPLGAVTGDPYGDDLRRWVFLKKVIGEYIRCLTR